MFVLVQEASTSAAKALLYDNESGIVTIQNEAYTPDMG